MNQGVVDVIIALCVFFLSPSVVLGSLIAFRALKLRERQLELESQKLELERQKLEYLTTENQKQLLDELKHHS